MRSWGGRKAGEGWRVSRVLCGLWASAPGSSEELGRLEIWGVRSLTPIFHHPGCKSPVLLGCPT